MAQLSKILTVLLFFTHFICQSQSEIYMDEQMKPIDTLTYAKKCRQYPYKCVFIPTDSILIYKVLKKYDFGSLSPEAYNQIRKLLILDSKKNIETNDVIVVKYVDTLRDYLSDKRKYRDHLDSVNIISSLVFQSKISTKPHDRKLYQKHIRSWIKKSKKCVKKYEKRLPVSINYVYDYEQDALETYGDFNIVKDRGIFKNLFFKIVCHYNLLILRPDGSYFLSGYHISDKDVKKLIETQDWSEFKNDWRSTLDLYKINGYGLFEKPDFSNHITHCF